MKNRLRYWKVFLFALLLILNISFALNVFLASNSKNPISLNAESPGFFVGIFKQSWKFFTKSAKAKQMLIYRLNGGELHEVNNKNTQLENAFGVLKRNRVLSHIICAKYDEVPKKYKCYYRGKLSLTLIKRLEEEDKITTLKLKHFKFMPKGKYLIQFIVPKPWAWFSTIEKPIYMPSELIIYNVI